MCNIAGGGGSDLKVDHLFQGLELSLKGTIEKHSDVLGRNAQWKRTRKISRLPQYMCVQYMRFYWKSREPTAMNPSTGTNCKMKRRVRFQDTIDMFKFCSPALQDILRVPREAEVDLKAHEHIEEGGEAKKSDDGASKSQAGAAAADAATDAAADAGGAAAMDVDEEDADLAAAMAMSQGSSTGSSTGAKFAGYGLPADFQGHYELFAVVTHIGASANSGHYMGWTRREKGSDKWIRFNDEAVDEAATADILELAGGTGQGDMAYLCFYRQLK